MYMQARYYDPVIGRFYSNDPVGTMEHLHGSNGIHGFNRYTYANNNPYKYTDPNGESSLAINGARMMFVPVPGARVVGGIMLAGAGLIALNEMSNDSSDDSGVIIDDKIKDQLGDRGWTEGEINDLVGNTEPSGESTDNRRPNKTPDGKGRSDSASVYGTKDGGHVVVNDNTNEVTHVSDKNDPNWIPDSRIKWKEDN
jgi:RHS repeat-associated protein